VLKIIQRALLAYRQDYGHYPKEIIISRSVRGVAYFAPLDSLVVGSRDWEDVTEVGAIKTIFGVPVVGG
jgi:hypothetical protein